MHSWTNGETELTLASYAAFLIFLSRHSSIHVFANSRPVKKIISRNAIILI